RDALGCYGTIGEFQSNRRADGHGDKAGVGERSEFDDPDPVTELWQQAMRRSEGKACLANSPSAGERHESMGDSEAQDFKQAVVPADQLGNWLRQVCRWCNEPWLRRNRASVGTSFHVFSRKTALSCELI